MQILFFGSNLHHDNLSREINYSDTSYCHDLPYSIRYTINKKNKIKQVYIYKLGCVVINKRLKDYKEYKIVIEESISRKYEKQNRLKNGEFIITIQPVCNSNNQITEYRLLGLYQ